MTTPMDPYEEKAWEALLGEREKRGKSRLSLPGPLKDKAEQLLTSAANRARELPGADAITAAVQKALGGLSDLSGRLAAASVSTSAVIERYNKAGAGISRLEDIRKLELRLVDDVTPRLDIGYATAVALQGAGAAAVITGLDVVVAGETAATGGVGAAPGVGVVLAAVAADSIGVLVASQRAIAHVASYYGYDVRNPDERLISLGVMGVGIATESTKQAAYRELSQLVQGLARRQTWKQLSEKTTTKIVQRVFSVFGFKLTKRRLGEALPVIGIPIAAGLNAKTLLSVINEADRFYRQRFLAERYGLEIPGAAGGDDEEHELLDIIDAEIVEEGDGPAA